MRTMPFFLLDMIIRQDDDGSWVAREPGWGIVTSGDTKQEAQLSLHELIQVYIAYHMTHGLKDRLIEEYKAHYGSDRDPFEGDDNDGRKGYWIFHPNLLSPHVSLEVH